MFTRKMNTVNKIIAGLAIAMFFLIVIVIILYQTGIEKQHYQCTLDKNYAITLTSCIDNNGFRENSYQLSLAVYYNGIKAEYDLLNAGSADVAVGLVVTHKNAKERKYLMVITQNTSILIDSERLTVLDRNIKLSDYGTLVSQSFISIPGCQHKDSHTFDTNR